MLDGQITEGSLCLPTQSELAAALYKWHGFQFKPERMDQAPKTVKLTVRACGWALSAVSVKSSGELATSSSTVFQSEDPGTLWYAAQTMLASVKRKLAAQGFRVGPIDPV